MLVEIGTPPNEMYLLDAKSGYLCYTSNVSNHQIVQMLAVIRAMEIALNKKKSQFTESFPALI